MSVCLCVYFSVFVCVCVCVYVCRWVCVSVCICMRKYIYEHTSKHTMWRAVRIYKFHNMYANSSLIKIALINKTHEDTTLLEGDHLNSLLHVTLSKCLHLTNNE